MLFQEASIFSSEISLCGIELAIVIVSVGFRPSLVVDRFSGFELCVFTSRVFNPTE